MLSYHPEDEKLVTEVYDRLKYEGYDTWIDIIGGIMESEEVKYGLTAFLV